jgi:chemotaxis protein MotB
MPANGIMKTTFFEHLKISVMKSKIMLAATTFSILLFTSCVSKKVMRVEKVRYETLQGEYNALQSRLKDCNDLSAENQRKMASLNTDLETLRKENAFLKDNNNQALKQLENLSVISSSQAESIKKSLDNIGS